MQVPPRVSLERQRLLGVGHGALPGVPLLEVPAGVEHGVDETPGFGPLPIEGKFGAEAVQAAAINLAGHGVRIPQELADIEAAVADETLRIDYEPRGTLRAEDI